MVEEYNPNNDLKEHEVIQIVIPKGEHKKRIDIYLTNQIENATRNKVQQAIDKGLVLVNGKIVKSSYKLNPYDQLQITLPRPPKHKAEPENILLDILYEDEFLLVVNKPAGMVTHPAFGNYTGTLVNALLYHCNSLSTLNTETRPGIVHRLDKDTTGLMLVAKTDFAHSFLAAQFAKRTIEREYWAIIWGKLKNSKGIIEANLGRSKKDRKKVAVTDEGKKAITEYEVIAEYDFLSLIKLHLKTGRTHQIRVHLAHIGHPVFGDPTYGGRSENWSGISGSKSLQAVNLLKIISRQALHAKTIGFIHPSSKQFEKFDSNIPADMQTIIDKINK